MKTLIYTRPLTLIHNMWRSNKVCLSTRKKKKTPGFLCIEWIKEEGNNKGRGKSDFKIIHVRDVGIMDKSSNILNDAYWSVMEVGLSGHEEELDVRSDCKRENKNDSWFFYLSNCTVVYSCVNHGRKF